jgi:hypothetical protein
LAKIYAGMKEVRVEYEAINAYPIVQIRPYGATPKHFWVMNATDRSFVIQIGEASAKDTVFAWTVIPSQTGNAIYFSDDTSVMYDPTTGSPIGPTAPPAQETPPTNTETNPESEP